MPIGSKPNPVRSLIIMLLYRSMLLIKIYYNKKHDPVNLTERQSNKDVLNSPIRPVLQGTKLYAYYIIFYTVTIVY